ncbi:MAG: DUF4350 domain-containing protein [Spirochaetales bacterium]|nr:DUF4350 domain-containing protein [Spirochaetales bacterium]
MNRKKISPVVAISIISIIFIVLFLMVGASGFSGILPGSNLFSNKDDNGYYVFFRILEELDYQIIFEKRYKIPAAERSVIVYIDSVEEEDLFSDEQITLWVRNGNTLVLFGETIDWFMGADIIEPGEQEEINYQLDKFIPSSPVFASDYIPVEIFNEFNESTIIADNQNGIIIGQIKKGKGKILLISDRSVFNNNNMHNLQNALLLNNLVSDLQGIPIYLRERYPVALYNPPIIRELLIGRLFYLSAHLILLFSLFIYMTGKRFSRPEILSGKKQRKITEHLKAVGLFYQKAGAFELIEQIDSKYFKTVICRNKKPVNLSDEEFSDYTECKNNIDKDEIVRRFSRRHSLIVKTRDREIT